VLDLHVDVCSDGDLAHQLSARWLTFVACAVTYFVIGVIWINHHVLFALIERIDRALLFENLLLLTAGG
jgi:uncharacterized membrane protein